MREGLSARRCIQSGPLSLPGVRWWSGAVPLALRHPLRLTAGAKSTATLLRQDRKPSVASAGGKLKTEGDGTEEAEGKLMGGKS